MSKIIVIIPTYNERTSVSRLIEALEREFDLIPGNGMGILIVDGNSPDGTADIVKEKMKKYRNLNLLVEKEKRGLGMAYVRGIKYAVSRLGADAFIEFDGDFQHDPEDIRRLVAEFDNGYDYVIGSRYVSGGSIPEDWVWYRKALSRFGSRFAKFVLRLPTEDNTSGFKLTRVAGFVDSLPLSEERLLTNSYAYKIQFLYEMIKAGARTKEVPIRFLERQGGNSKSSFRDIWESLRVVASLYFHNLRK